MFGFLCNIHLPFEVLCILTYENIYLFLSQICPQPADVVEIFIYLGEPCHVCQLLLTISHGADDSTYPSTVDVRTGRHLDGLKLVLEVCICSSLCLTHLVYAFDNTAESDF